MMPFRRINCLSLAAVLAVLVPVTAGAQSFNHSAFDALLGAHVVDGMVDYDGFARAPEFEEYLNSLAAFEPQSLPRPEGLRWP
ncbi:MAG: hypothetical protein SF070_03600 [Gemmatimonadota bacterium]|nr:hypothetical protein [Gemmatimonadota bacterium]